MITTATTIIVTGLDPMLTTAQAAKLIGASGHTMKDIIESNDIPVVLIGKRRKIRVADLQAWVESTKGRRADG